MKKQLIFTIFTCLLYVYGSAQDFSFGAKGGVNITSIGGGSNFGVAGLGSKVSFHLGGVAEVPISEKFAVQPELLYSSQGTKWNFSGLSSLKLDYINLPILCKYFILQGLSAEAGPVVGFLISTNGIKENYNSLDVGIGIGASYKLNDNIFFSLRYNKGLTDINKDDALTISNQNNVFQISAGYAF